MVDEGEITKPLPIRFKNWLAKELTDLRTRASCSVPEKFPKDFEWKWEVCLLVFLASKMSNVKPLPGSLFFPNY